MKRYCLALLFLVTSAFWYTPTQAASTDVEAFSGSGIYNNIDLWRLDQNGIMYLSTSTQNTAITFSPSTGITLAAGKNIVLTSNGNLFRGVSTVAVSTTATPGMSQGDVFTAFLKDGGAGVGTIAVTEGMVLCSTTASTNAGTSVTVVACPAVNAFAPVIGIAVAAASTGSVVNVYNDGWALALTTGTVTAGDQLATSSLSQGFLATTVTSTNNVVGIALGAGTSSGGLTRIKIR